MVAAIYLPNYHRLIDRLINVREVLLYVLKEEKETELFARNSTGLVRQGRWIDAFIFNSSASWMFGTLIFALSTIVYFDGSGSSTNTGGGPSPSSVTAPGTVVSDRPS